MTKLAQSTCMVNQRKHYIQDFTCVYLMIIFEEIRKDMPSEEFYKHAEYRTDDRGITRPIMIM